MKKRATAVIGANYGDEGKGLITDWLVSRQPKGSKTVVARFNGGAQAGHTVQTPEGKRHVFHHFGSGTLLGADTFLAKHFVLNPILWYKEMIELHKLTGAWPGGDVAADPRCYVTTPYDMIINQVLEDSRDTLRHGSCGVGFGETIERNRFPAFRLSHQDLLGGTRVANKLHIIRDRWLPRRLQKLGIRPIAKDDPRLDNRLLKRTADTFAAFAEMVEVAGAEFLRSKNVIFEGAQGLALDMDGPDFPHVTRSNTGLTNVVTLAKLLRLDLDVIYVTRTYFTRHGAGPLPKEFVPSVPITDQTNVDHPYQGSIRFGAFDTSAMKERVSKDLMLAPKAKASIAVTCCDQMPVEKIRGWLEKICPVRLASYGPSRNDIKELELVA
ncbi:MAG: adenylosuccinate synthetase [Geminicoccaceae bacterium]